MRKITRFYDDDLRELVAEKYNVPLDNVISVFTEETVGYFEGERTQPVFYIEFEENKKKD